MNIKTKKYLVIPVILLCLSGIVDARWHFHGGSVKDIPNRIKQAVETAKQNEVLIRGFHEKCQKQGNIKM